MNLLSIYPYSAIINYQDDDEYRNSMLQLTSYENWASFSESIVIDEMQFLYDLIIQKYPYCTTNSLSIIILMSYDYLSSFHQCMKMYCEHQLEKKMR